MINGVVAVQIMVLLMVMAVQGRVMGEFKIGPGLTILGWAATTALFGAVIGMGVTMMVGGK